eukprot:gene31302-1088_t
MATASSQGNDDLLKSIFEMVESKGSEKKERKKRVMTAEQKAKAIANLAKGGAKTPEPKPEPAPAPKPEPAPEPKPTTPPPILVKKDEPKPAPKPQLAPIKEEPPVHVQLKPPPIDTDPHRMTTWGNQSLW